MSGKKIDRKKQSLLSRSAKRGANIKKLTFKPVLRNVDIEAIKNSFKKAESKPAEIKKAAPGIENTAAPAAAESAQKKTRKPKKES